MIPLTRALARYVHASRFDALPPAVRREGVRAFVNWVGCAAGGAREANVAHVLAILDEFNGARDTTVAGHALKLDRLNAAAINAMSSAALAFNDTHYATVAHPTSPVAAVLLALAEHRPMSGSDFLHALVLGIEIQCRIGNLLFTSPAQCNVGLSMAGLVGGIGAAIAAAKALGLDETGIATALGFTCSDSMLEGNKGFGVSFAAHPNFAAALDGLGSTFEILTLAYKPYPCGFVVHPAIDACLDLARAHDLDPAAIARVELTVSPLAAKLADRPALTDRNQTLTSLQHWAAVSLLQRAAGIAQMSEAALHDPAVERLRRAVTVAADPALGNEAARVRVALADGRAFDTQIAHCRGSAGRPLSDDELVEKTRAQCRLVYDEAKTARLIDGAWRIADSRDVGRYAAELAA